MVTFVAPVVLHVRVEDSPFSIVEGLADKLAVGLATSTCGGGGGASFVTGGFFLQPPASSNKKRERITVAWDITLRFMIYPSSK
jgi:hypothetical protein